jgi:hypothetical protein
MLETIIQIEEQGFSETVGETFVACDAHCELAAQNSNGDE